MKTYRVVVTGMVETSETYTIEAEDEDEACEKAMDEAEMDGFEDPIAHSVKGQGPTLSPRRE